MSEKQKFFEKGEIKQKEESHEMLKGLLLRVHKTLKERKEKNANLMRSILKPVLVSVLVGSSLYANNQTCDRAVPKAKTQITMKEIMFGGELMHDTKKIKVKLKAVNQENGVIETTYLINGRTDKEWWYQFGLESISGQFLLAYEVWDNKLRSVAPANGRGGGHELFHGNKHGIVNKGDTIELTLQIKDGFVYMSAIDLNTKSYGKLKFIAHGNIFKGEKTGSFEAAPTSIFTELNVHESFSKKSASKVALQTFKILYPKNVTSAIACVNTLTFSVQKPRASNSVTYSHGIVTSDVPHKDKTANMHEHKPGSIFVSNDGLVINIGNNELTMGGYDNTSNQIKSAVRYKYLHKPSDNEDSTGE